MSLNFQATFDQNYHSIILLDSRLDFHIPLDFLPNSPHFALDSLLGIQQEEGAWDSLLESLEALCPLDFSPVDHWDKLARVLPNESLLEYGARALCELLWEVGIF